MILFVSMILNLMFFITRIQKYFILKKIGKTMEMLDYATVIDVTLFVLGILIIMWSLDIRSVLINIKDNGNSKPTDF